MLTTLHTVRREALRATLARRAGNAPTTRSVADAALGIWQQIAARLEPVIGAGGVDVLFGRSLHLTGKAFPWLAAAGAKGNSAASLGSLRACLETHETQVAAAAGLALLAGFTELLAGLIGESLTDRLLGNVWLLPLAISELETTQ